MIYLLSLSSLKILKELLHYQAIAGNVTVLFCILAGISINVQCSLRSLTHKALHQL